MACTQTPCLSCLAGGGELAWRLLLLLGDEYVPTILYCHLQGAGFLKPAPSQRPVNGKRAAFNPNCSQQYSVHSDSHTVLI